MSDSFSYSSSNSDDLDPSKVLDKYISEQNVLGSFASRIIEKMKGRFGAGRLKRQGGTIKTIRRDHVDAHSRLVADYFAEHPLYPERMFRTRFRMHKPLFLRIVEALSQWSPYFTQRGDCSGHTSLSPLQKCTAALRMLAYGTPADALDEYLKIGKSTALECLEMFSRGVIVVFGGTYLRRPTREDVEHILHVNESRGFPGMLGSIDCMHWRWESCPRAWRGQFTRGDYKVPTIILEAVASHDLWIWHAFFGVAGSNNDINVLNQSPLFLDTVRGEAPRVHYYVNGEEYNHGYYLDDGIYPEWAVFQKTIPLPQIEKHKLYAEHQEGARKDVERAFGVLQARFNIVRRSAKKWKRKSIGNTMLACVILHNMIVEDEGEDAICDLDLNRIPRTSIVLPPEVTSGGNPCFRDVLSRKAAIRARSMHTQLKTDLIEHIWNRFRNMQRA
uniref:Uncharacterized protein n=2 Tax=Oryza sativa subsp. japonica TaxID=39947 RepID=Q5W653_ORYSJ|nr:uncharacterized protein LOC107280959 [Oryza sativa Japonica Group]AAV43824.1 hypothetical protein [Oryza sativa Japonica Group]AAV44104.1 hypothetical protein [Oryza sativa Japonica Group]